MFVHIFQACLKNVPSTATSFWLIAQVAIPSPPKPQKRTRNQQPISNGIQQLWPYEPSTGGERAAVRAGSRLRPTPRVAYFGTPTILVVIPHPSRGRRCIRHVLLVVTCPLSSRRPPRAGGGRGFRSNMPKNEQRRRSCVFHESSSDALALFLALVRQ